MVPGFAVTTDIIVGFPGETEEDFATRSPSSSVWATRAFSFIYSPRRETEAAALDGQLLTRFRASAWGAWWIWSSTTRPSARSASSFAPWRCWWRAPRGPILQAPGRGAAATRP